MCIRQNDANGVSTTWAVSATRPARGGMTFPKRGCCGPRNLRAGSWQLGRDPRRVVAPMLRLAKAVGGLLFLVGQCLVCRTAGTIHKCVGCMKPVSRPRLPGSDVDV